MDIDSLPPKLQTTANIQLQLETAARSLRAAQRMAADDAGNVTDDDFLEKLAIFHEESRKLKSAIYNRCCAQFIEESKTIVGE